MSNCVFTYISNQKKIGYPVDLIFKNFPCQKILFIGDENSDLTGISFDLYKEIKVVNTGIVITRPTDISKAQNWCIDWLVKNTKYQFFIHPQADVYLPQEGTAILLNKIPGLSPSNVYNIVIDRIRLYYECREMNFGFQIIGRDTEARYVGDGANLSQDKIMIPGIKAIDVGYFGLNNYRKHATNHKDVWSETRSDFSMWNKDFAEFINACKTKAIKREGYKKTIKPEDYKEIFEYFDLAGEYSKIKHYL